jgi:hypothetical protein
MSLTARLGFDAASSPNRLLVITKRTAEYDGVAAGGPATSSGRHRNHRNQQRGRGSRHKNRHQRTTSSASAGTVDGESVAVGWWKQLKAAAYFWAARGQKGT